MRPTLLALIIGTLHASLFSQRSYESQSYSHQVELRHDNDFFVLTDKHYSSGLFLTYRMLPKEKLFSNGAEQLEFELTQQVYTPERTKSTNTSNFDRPYAGFLGLNSTWSVANDKQFFKVKLLTGIVGPNSGAGGFQRWYHKNIIWSSVPPWTDELRDSFHLNLYLTYAKEWHIAPNPFGINVAVSPSLALGSRDTYAEQEIVAYFGRRNGLSKSIAYNRLGNNDREIYFALRLAYRHVFYNGLIEGNLFGDDSKVLRDIETSLLRLGFDFNHRFDRNDYKVGIRYLSPETPNAESHIYLQLSYAFSF
ncbi:MAG: lipid A-modifier LpxR family protein [Bacteroidota bacterium]